MVSCKYEWARVLLHKELLRIHGLIIWKNMELELRRYGIIRKW